MGFLSGSARYRLISARARTLFRKAQLQAKRNAELSRRKERELLFADVDEGAGSSKEARRRGGAQDKLSQDELVVNASQDVTAALRRTHQMMQSELSRSQFARDTLGACLPSHTRVQTA